MAPPSASAVKVVSSVKSSPVGLVPVPWESAGTTPKRIVSSGVKPVMVVSIVWVPSAVVVSV